MLRLNYDAQNGHPYTAVGRFLVERKIYTREEISMQKIREWMEANPDEGEALRRENKSYVFFKRDRARRRRRAAGRAGRGADAGPLDRGRPQPAHLWHAVLHRRGAADPIREARHQIPPPDGRAGYRRRHHRSGARRHLSRRRRRGRARRRPLQAIRPFCHAGARTSSIRRGSNARVPLPLPRPKIDDDPIKVVERRDAAPRRDAGGRSRRRRQIVDKTVPLPKASPLKKKQ